MSKYGDVLALLEFGKKVGEENANAKVLKPMRTAPEKKKEGNPLALLEQKRQEYLAVKRWVEDQGKLDKPDDKKKKENWLSTTNIALFLIASSPVTGPLYVWWFRLMMG